MPNSLELQKRKLLTPNNKNSTISTFHSQINGKAIYVRNLPLNMDDSTLFDQLAEYGRLASVRLLRDDHQNFTGTAIAVFQRSKDALKAINSLRNSLLGEKRVFVAHWKPKFQRHLEMKVKRLRKTLNEMSLGEFDGPFTADVTPERMATAPFYLGTKAVFFPIVRTKL